MSDCPLKFDARHIYVPRSSSRTSYKYKVPYRTSCLLSGKTSPYFSHSTVGFGHPAIIQSIEKLLPASTLYQLFTIILYVSSDHCHMYLDATGGLYTVVKGGRSLTFDGLFKMCNVVV